MKITTLGIAGVPLRPLVDDAFNRSLKFVLAREGTRFADRSSDLGGPTKCGITQTTYNIWNDSNGIPRRTVALITDLEVATIYDQMYWMKSGCDKLPWPLNICVFDMAVNQGPVRALAAVKSLAGSVDYRAVIILRRYLYIRTAAEDKVHGAPNLEGWLSRLDLLCKEIA